MALPVGTTGRSWITGSQGSPPLSLPLPEVRVVQYYSDMGDYAPCGLGSHYRPTLLSIATSSITNVRAAPILITNWFIFTTVSPGLIDTITYEFRNGLEFDLTGITFFYGLAATTHSRYGTIVNNPTGGLNAQITLLPQNETFFDSPIYGDMWMGEGGGWKYQDRGATGALYTAIILGSRQSSISASAARYAANDGPQNVHVGTSLVAVDRWFASAIPSGSTGIRNWTWDGGIHMPRSGAVAIYGANKLFRVPSGSVRVLRDVHVSSLDALQGSIRTSAVNPSRLQLYSGSVRISGSFRVQGTSTLLYFPESGSARVNGAQFSTFQLVSGSHNSLFDAFDATWYVYSGGGAFDSNFAYVRAGTEWVTILSGSTSYSLIDGGVF